MNPNRIRWGPALASALLWMGSAMSLPGCQRAPGEEAGGLENAFEGRRALAEAVLEAIERRDREALERHLVTRAEHRTLLWNRLPESDYFTFEYARRLNERSTRKAILRALERYGGQPLRYADLTFEKDTEVYEDFVLHRGGSLRVRHAETGEEMVVPVLDVVLERHGGFKPMNYEE